MIFRYTVNFSAAAYRAGLRTAGDRGPAHGRSGVLVPGGGLRHGHVHLQAPTLDGARLHRVVADSIRERSVAGQAKARIEGRFFRRQPSLIEQQREYIQVERSNGMSHRELAKRLEVSRWPSKKRTGRSWVEIAASARSMADWQPAPVPARAAPQQSSSIDRYWPKGAYQVYSATERIKLCQGQAKKSPIEQTLASSAGTAKLPLDSISVLSN